MVFVILHLFSSKNDTQTIKYLIPYKWPDDQ